MSDDKNLSEQEPTWVTLRRAAEIIGPEPWSETHNLLLNRASVLEQAERDKLNPIELLSELVKEIRHLIQEGQFTILDSVVDRARMYIDNYQEKKSDGRQSTSA